MYVVRTYTDKTYPNLLSPFNTLPKAGFEPLSIIIVASPGGHWCDSLHHIGQIIILIVYALRY